MSFLIALYLKGGKYVAGGITDSMLEKVKYRSAYSVMHACMPQYFGNIVVSSSFAYEIFGDRI